MLRPISIRNINRPLQQSVIIILVIVSAAVLGRNVPRYQNSTLPLILLGGGLLIYFYRAWLALALLGALSMIPNPTVFDVQGREIAVLHILGVIVVGLWLLRRLALERRLRPPDSYINGPALVVIGVWLLSALAGYTFWDIRVTTVHRQPLFLLAEVGQIILLYGVFLVAASQLQTMRQIKIVGFTIIFANALTYYPLQMGAFNQLPVALAILYAWLLYAPLKTRVRLGLVTLLLVMFVGALVTQRIPVLVVFALVILSISFFKSKRLFFVLMLLSITFGIVVIRPLWLTETSVEFRQELAQIAWQMFLDHPILGAGATYYRSYALLYNPLAWRTVQSGLLLPHNGWLYHLADTGLLGLAVMLWLCAAIFYSGWRLYQQAEDGYSKGLGLALVGALAGVATQTYGGHMSLIPYYGMESFYIAPMWILMGMVAARLGSQAQEAGEKKQSAVTSRVVK